MNREKSFEFLNKYVKDEFYIRHSEAVEIIMRKLALDPYNIELWGIAGLLHDLDEEFVDWKSDMTLHGPKLKNVKISSIVRRFKEERYVRGTSRPYMMQI